MGATAQKLATKEYLAWNRQSYPWPPPADWVRAKDGRWWPLSSIEQRRREELKHQVQPSQPDQQASAAILAAATTTIEAQDFGRNETSSETFPKFRQPAKGPELPAPPEVWNIAKKQPTLAVETEGLTIRLDKDPKPEPGTQNPTSQPESKKGSKSPDLKASDLVSRTNLLTDLESELLTEPKSIEPNVQPKAADAPPIAHPESEQKQELKTETALPIAQPESELKQEQEPKVEAALPIAQREPELEVELRLEVESALSTEPDLGADHPREAVSDTDSSYEAHAEPLAEIKAARSKKLRAQRIAERVSVRSLLDATLVASLLSLGVLLPTSGGIEDLSEPREDITELLSRDSQTQDGADIGAFETPSRLNLDLPNTQQFTEEQKVEAFLAQLELQGLSTTPISPVTAASLGSSFCTMAAISTSAGELLGHAEQIIALSNFELQPGRKTAFVATATGIFCPTEAARLGLVS